MVHYAQVRDLQIRESESVLKWGSVLLAKHPRSLPYEESAPQASHTICSTPSDCLLGLLLPLRRNQPCYRCNASFLRKCG